MYMSVLPAFFYLLICFHTTTDFQIRAAAFLSAVYAIIMMSVVVGTTIQIAEDSWTSPNAVFLMLLFSIFFIAACMHPQEFWCIVPGLLYFICIPSGYLFLLIYSLCNLNIVSWGTREAPKTKKNLSKEEVERAKMQELSQAKQKSAGFLNQVSSMLDAEGGSKNCAYSSTEVFANFNFKKYDERIRSCARKWLGLQQSGLNGLLLQQILGAVERMEKVRIHSLNDGRSLISRLQSKFDEEMEAVASTGLYPPAGKTHVGSEIDAKYGLMQLAAEAASPVPTAGGPGNRASFPQIDPQQQLVYRGLNNARSTPYGQIMSYAGVSRPLESPQIPKRDELGRLYQSLLIDIYVYVFFQWILPWYFMNHCEIRRSLCSIHGKSNSFNSWLNGIFIHWLKTKIIRRKSFAISSLCVTIAVSSSSWSIHCGWSSSSPFNWFRNVFVITSSYRSNAYIMNRCASSRLVLASWFFSQASYWFNSFPCYGIVTGPCYICWHRPIWKCSKTMARVVAVIDVETSLQTMWKMLLSK